MSVLIIRDSITGQETRKEYENTLEGRKQLQAWLVEQNLHRAKPSQPAPKPLEDPIIPTKVWDIFFSKLNLYKTLPINKWNHYQFLGFINSKLDLDIKPVKVYPSIHPLLIRVRKLIAIISGDVNMDNMFDRIRFHLFLEDCFREDPTIVELDDLFSLSSIWREQNPLPPKFKDW